MRKHMLTQRYKLCRNNAIKIQARMRAMIQCKRFKTVERSTLKIQTRYREHLKRKHLKIEREREKKRLELAIKQNEEKARLKAQKERKAAVRIQKSIRGSRIKRQFAAEKRSVVMVQKTVRGHLGRRIRKRREMTKMISKINNDAAVVLQKRTRGFLQRKSYLKSRAERIDHSDKELQETTSEGGPMSKVVRHIEQMKEAGRGFDLPKVRTAGFAHVKRFRDSNRLPNLLDASEKSKVPVRAPVVSAGSNSVSLPNLRPANGLVNPNWGRGNVKVVGGMNGKRNSNNRIRSLNASNNTIAKLQTKAQLRTKQRNAKREQGQQPKWGNNFGIRNQYGLYKS